MPRRVSLASSRIDQLLGHTPFARAQFVRRSNGLKTVDDAGTQNPTGRPKIRANSGFPAGGAGPEVGTRYPLGDPVTTSQTAATPVFLATCLCTKNIMTSAAIAVPTTT